MSVSVVKLENFDFSKTIYEIEGVFCTEPSGEQKKNETSYIEYISNAELLYTPAMPIKKIVTRRKEKYRKYTIDWLKKNNISYDELIMMPDDLRDNNEDISLYKLMYYCDSDADLFVESDAAISKEMFDEVNQSVYCTSNDVYYKGNSDIDIYLLEKAKENSLENIINDAFVRIKELQNDGDLSYFINDIDDLMNTALLNIYKKIRKVAKVVDERSCTCEEHRNDYIRTKRVLFDNIVNHGYENATKGLLKNWEKGAFLDDFVQKYDVNSVQVDFDNSCNMFYTMHNGKRLYLNWQTKQEAKIYYNGLLIEQDDDSPHRYFSEKIYFEDGDIFVDVGAAEGFISLDVIDKAEKVYVLECNELWCKALKKTFSDYKNKVSIFSKYAGMEDNDTTIKLDTLLNDYVNVNITIKLDVEGMEIEVLRGALKTLRRNKCKIVCASYHYHNEADDIIDFFTEIGYKYEISSSYMVFNCVKDILRCGKYERYDEPDFRRGMIRAYNG